VARGLPGVTVAGLAARSSWRHVLLQAKEFRAHLIALEDPSSAEAARREKDALELRDLEVLEGVEGTLKVATMPGADVVVHAIPGFRGVRPLIASLQAGKRVAFAGKEALVSAGELIAPYLRQRDHGLVPVDSEHSAVFQALLGEDPASIAEIVLTASGGALRDFTAEEMSKVTPADVLAHPTWRMGRKITVDSATLFNKALEVVEAHYLFGVPYSRIKVVIHRESVVHAMVTFVDGSTKAQAARPDMKLAIAYGITHPDRRPGIIPSLCPYVGTLTFEEPDFKRFPSLKLGFRAGEMGGTAPCVLSAADEILVEEFLSGHIGFLDIQRVLGAVLDSYEPRGVTGLEVLEAEKAWADRTVRRLLS
jgi:1-deoxy-D-xylulose-5-phosphate reductoisomerase